MRLTAPLAPPPIAPGGLAGGARRPAHRRARQRQAQRPAAHVTRRPSRSRRAPVPRSRWSPTRVRATTRRRRAATRVFDRLDEGGRPGHHRVGRLRQLHVVECPRLRTARAAGHPGGGGHDDQVRRAHRTRGARTSGCPRRASCIVDHPLGGTDEATIVAWADAAVDEIIALFTRK